MKLKKFLVKCVRFYQGFIRIYLKPSCVFYPTCSDYAIEAIQKHGVLYGTYLAVKRILQCHPWQKNHIDPVK